MKSILSRALLCVFLAGAAMAQGQQVPASQVQTRSTTAQTEKEKSTDEPLRFDLTFKGGSIHALVDAISTARGKLLNIYIPQEAESVEIAPFHVSGVTAKELLEALSRGSLSTQRNSATSFVFSPVSEGRDPSMWVTNWGYTGNSNTPVPMCHVYSLSPYLEAGLSVDDITTAIRTAWKMLNYTPASVNLSYHRETKLLIAVAPETELQAIEQVLNALPKGPQNKKAITLPTEAPKSPAAKL
jgi:hypothetical protein